MRLAFNYAFDFEEMNRQIFFGQYKRIASYFEGTELAATGLPTGRELEILQTVRDKFPPEVFTTPYTNPVGGNPEAVRNNLRQAVQLLHDGRLRGAQRAAGQQQDGEPYAVEFLADDPSFERVFLFYKPSLDRLGITVTVRTVDDVQYREPAAQLGFRHHHQRLGRIAVARQRAARLLGLAGGRSARLVQPDRHQKSGGRRDDRSGDLRQEPRRSRRRHQGARPRAAVEPLRRAAMDLRQSAQRALGPLQPPRSDAEIRHGGVSDRSGGGTPPKPPRRERGRDSARGRQSDRSAAYG